MDLDLAPLVARFRETHARVENQLADPTVARDRQRLEQLGREHQRLTEVLAAWESHEALIREMAETRELAANNADAELVELVLGELAQIEQRAAKNATELMALLLPPNAYDTGSVILEVRPAAGGEEAALFAAELARAYSRYAERHGWQTDILERETGDLGGLRFLALSLRGAGVWSVLAHESGVHRVQRVPVTEGSGRIHTSTVTVAVMPEPREVDVRLNPGDLEFTVTRSSGAGGQHVNTTDSAVRLVHRPSGLVVFSQQERSQIRNREVALRLLRARLLEREQATADGELAARRKSQVGTGERSERVRTWNFPQNRVTDHRFGLSWFNLPAMLEGELDAMLEQLQGISLRQRLEAELQRS